MLNYTTIRTVLYVIYVEAKYYIFEVSRTSKNFSFQSFCNRLKLIYTEQEYVTKLQINTEHLQIFKLPRQ